MAFWNSNGNKNNQSLDHFSENNDSKGLSEFYELEPAIVLDVILDENHPIFTSDSYIPPTIPIDHWPVSFNGTSPLLTDLDYSWIGRILIRPIETQKSIEKPKLTWALPLHDNFIEYPLINEIVICSKYLDTIYYSRKINIKNWSSANADFSLELLYGNNLNSNVELSDTTIPFSGPESKLSSKKDRGFFGVLGRYFWFNSNIRKIRKYEGDVVLESRFGQSIKLGAYDSDRKNDVGKYDQYKGSDTNPFSQEKSGGGNPQIIIRNRQRPLLGEGEKKVLHEKLPPIIGTKLEKNVGGSVDEDINNDGSTIAITSGLTISKWVTTCYKQIFSDGLEEQSKYSPNGSTPFKFPVLNGDQIVINSDRLLLSSRFGETFHYSKKRYSIITDSEYTVDSHDQIVLTTNNKTVINSPAIYLGEYDQTGEPVILGQTAINWLYQLCNLLIAHTHWYIHSHPDAGEAEPNQTQTPVQVKQFQQLRDTLHNLLSRRVFVTGGGFAPGNDGGKIKDGISPTSIKIDNLPNNRSTSSSTSGIPGGFLGSNNRV